MDDFAGLKAQLKRLMEQRGSMEAEIAQRSARLEAAGVGLQSPLVDAQVGWRRATGSSLLPNVLQ